jgi:hypothetical protein
MRGPLRPIRPGWAQSGWRRSGALADASPWGWWQVQASGTCCDAVSVRFRSRVNVFPCWIRRVARAGFRRGRRGGGEAVAIGSPAAALTVGQRFRLERPSWRRAGSWVDRRSTILARGTRRRLRHAGSSTRGRRPRTARPVTARIGDPRSTTRLPAAADGPSDPGSLTAGQHAVSRRISRRRAAPLSRRAS